MDSESRGTDSGEPFLDSTDKNVHPLRRGQHNDAPGTEQETNRLVTMPGRTDWPELESPEFRELVLSIIATAIRLNPFRPPEKDDDSRSS